MEEVNVNVEVGVAERAGSEDNEEVAKDAGTREGRSSERDGVAAALSEHEGSERKEKEKDGSKGSSRVSHEDPDDGVRNAAR